jgi:hypothetical protein
MTRITGILFTLGIIISALIMAAIRADLLPEFIRGMFSFGYIPHEPGAM